MTLNLDCQTSDASLSHPIALWLWNAWNNTQLAESSLKLHFLDCFVVVHIKLLPNRPHHVPLPHMWQLSFVLFYPSLNPRLSP